MTAKPKFSGFKKSSSREDNNILKVPDEENPSDNEQASDEDFWAQLEKAENKKRDPFQKAKK